MPIGAAALLLFRGGGGVPSLAPIARDDLGIDIAPGEPVDVQVLANDDLFGEAVTNFEVLAASGVHPEILPGNILRLWGLTPPPEHTNEYVINVPADPNYSLRFPRAGDPGLDVDVGGFFRRGFFYDQDVTIVFDPNTTYTLPSVFECWGGRNIRLIGGNFAGTFTGEMVFISNGGSVFIEGLRTDVSGVSSDAILQRQNANMRSALGGDNLPPATYYFQHVAIIGLNGSSGGVHADAFQIQGGLVTHLQVEECTITTGYQAFFIPYDISRPQGVLSAAFRWVDFAPHPLDFAGNAMYLYDPNNPNFARYPVDLYEVYLTESTNPSYQPWTHWWILPGAQTAAEPAVVSGDGLSMTWPNSGGFITGMAKKGPSPFGNFAHRAGLGYVSPWGTP